MAGVLKFLVGRNTTVITITAQDISALGVLTDTVNATGQLTSGRCDGIRIVNRNNVEMIMSIDDTITNHVSLYQDYSIELTEILVQKVGAGGLPQTSSSYEPILPYLFNKLASGTSTYEYFKITITKGGVNFISRMSSCASSVNDKSKPRKKR